MKRALMTFGNPFGLALYDKKQADVEKVPPPKPAPPPEKSDQELDFTDALREFKSLDAVKMVMQDNDASLKALPNGGYERVRAEATKVFQSLKKDAA
jgi:hypothetical protein